MQFNPLFALTLLAVFARVDAQNATSTSSAPTPTYTDHFTPCGYGCALTSGKEAGCDFTEQSCLCSNQQYQQLSLFCVQHGCPPADYQLALEVVQTVCGTPASNDNSTVASTSSTSASASMSTTNALLQATNPSNAALKTGFGHDFGGMVGMGVAVVGVIAGAALIL
ncbi:hypothetical protein C8Q76DRAFT_763838 [Earliella scabrosa]|nr:hypothetical protein C8Q76DRAFT_763838 [Earliella scabrosa]